MKRSKLKRISKMPISRLQRLLWTECKRIVRKLHGNVCYTCGAGNLSSSNWQTGHMWSKASVGAFLKYDVRILRPQCMTCNLWQGGRGADFYSRMLKEIGQQKMHELEKDRQVTVKAYDFYVELLEKYKQL